MSLSDHVGHTAVGGHDTPEAPSQLQVGSLRLDLISGTVQYRQRPVSVTATEFRVLRVLMQRPGTLLDRSTLESLSHCQDALAHIRALRRKFSEYLGGPLLRGSRHTGYAIDARRHPRSPRNAGLALKYHLLQLI